MAARRILIAGSEDAFRSDLVALLRRGTDSVLSLCRPADLERVATSSPHDLLIVLSNPGGAQRVLESVRRLRADLRDIPVLFVAAAGSETLAVQSFRSGVSDYFSRPCPPGEVVSRAAACLSGAAGLSEPDDGAIIGESSAIRQIRNFARRVAASSSNVLVTGETGTGKELIALLIHRSGPSAGRPFVSINCPAVPDTLFESELFGHHRGAFTGAHQTVDGRLMAADGGTIFFDEIGDLSLTAQAKILRVIEAREIHRVGGGPPARLRGRIIAATNQPLDRLTSEGRFRRDLYYRLNVARIHLPPLRERLDDIPLLVDHYVRGFGGRDPNPPRCSGEVVRLFEKHGWPGNIRELKNVLEASFLNLDGPVILPRHLPALFLGDVADSAHEPGERDRMIDALRACNWNKSRAAEQLHWSRMTLYRKLARYGVGRGEPVETPPRVI